MTRTPAIALAVLATCALLAAVLATTRAAAVPPARADALPALSVPAPASPPPQKNVCVAGAGDSISALATGGVDATALTTITRLAFAADRTAERLRAAPAWPQRMGAGVTATRTCVPVAAP